MRRFTLFVFSIAVLGSIIFLSSHNIVFATPAVEHIRTAESTLINNQGENIGDLKITQGPEGIVIDLSAHSLPPGKHGMHFHEIGTCKDHDHFKMAKGHIMPTGKPHGYLNFDGGPHEGNLPNLIVHADGTVHVELYSSLLSINGNGDKPSLLDKDGSTLIIHVNEDDHITQPIGGAGARIACGVITP